MSDPATGAGPASTSWRVANVVLVLVALTLIAASTLLFTKGAGATPGDSQAETLSKQYAEVTQAAEDGTKAFLTVDYKNMDPLIDDVLARSTGNFKQQYERAKVNLKATAQDGLATSTGTVAQVGISDIDDSDAVVFVAADSKVSNKSTQGKPPQDRSYRLKLTMSHKGDKWLISDLQFVG